MKSIFHERHEKHKRMRGIILLTTEEKVFLVLFVFSVD